MNIIKISLKQVVRFLAYSYSAFIICYFILRLIFWDRLWIVAFIGTFTPLIFLPILFLPLVGFLIIKNRWFSIRHLQQTKYRGIANIL